MKSKQFAWLYLVKHGSPEMEHEYYGGYTPTAKAREVLKNLGAEGWFDRYEKLAHHYEDLIKEIGVDWEKTQAPESDVVSTFQGTHCDSGSREILTGTLVLKDGQTILYNAYSVEVTNVFDMMERVSEAEAHFKEFFGE